MKKIFNTFKKIIAILLTTTLLYNNITPSIYINSFEISAYSQEENHSALDSPRTP